MSYQSFRTEHLAVADPALKQEIEDVLQSGFRWLLFPSHLERFFTDSYRNLALNNIASNSVYLAVLYIVMGLVAFVQFRDLDKGIFEYTYLLIGGGLGLIYTCARFHRLNRWFHWYTGVTSMIMLTAILTTAATARHPAMLAGLNAISIYAVIVVYAMSKMRFYNTVIWCQLAGVFNLALVSLYGLQQTLFEFQTFFLIANVIGMGIAYIIEHRERVLFLQRLLLDIDQREKDLLNEHLERLSRQDALTGLANRRYFDECLKLEWSRCMREKKPLSIILLDIDYFKQYNDHYGHQAGDHCLMQVARALKQEASRPAELVGRYGGEEFILLYPNIDASQIRNTLVRIQQRIVNQSIPHEGSKIAKVVTASLGAATVYPVKDLNPEKLISSADQMLYKSKKAGRNGWFNTQLSESEPEQQNLINLS